MTFIRFILLPLHIRITQITQRNVHLIASIVLTGEVKNVKGTMADLREPQKLSKVIEDCKAHPSGIVNICYATRGPTGKQLATR